MLDEPLNLLIGSLWFILPAYFANGSPVLIGGGPPIDGGRLWRDGRRLFGDGKTWRGLIGGIAIGTFVGIFQYLIEGSPAVILRGFLLSFGALIGDLIGSFLKRRMNIPRGSPAIGMDQLGFMVVGMLLVFVTFPWSVPPLTFALPLFEGFPITLNMENLIAYAIILFPLTFLAHILTNLIVRRTI